MNMNVAIDLNKAKGAFYGCLVGDALGAPVEFKQRGSYPEVRNMLPCGHFDLPVGSFTDDGSLMLCLAAALLHTEGVHDPHVVLSHYLEWYRNGYMSVTGECFDIGRTTEIALLDYERCGALEADTTDENQAGNGSLMRIAPIPLLFGADEAITWDKALDESKTTHATEVATWCCGTWSVLVAKALKGANKADLVRYLENILYVPAACERFRSLEFLRKSRDEIRSSGYVVDTMEAALWALYSTDTFETGLITVVNLGADTDTVGAVYGTLAGALYGYEAIPSRWALQKREMVDNVWQDFSELCKKKWNLVET